MLENYRVGVSLLMNTSILDQLDAIIAKFEQLDALARNFNASNRAFANAVNGAGPAADFTKMAATSEKVAKAAADIARSMPDTAKAAEATATAWERAAAASKALVVYQSSSTQGILQGTPYTPYGYTPAGRPVSLPPSESGTALIPYSPPTGFTMGPGGKPMSYVPGGAPAPAPYTPWANFAGGPGPHTAWATPGALATVGGGAGGGGMPPLNWPPGNPPPPPGGGNLLHNLYQIDMGVHMVERFMELLSKALDQAEKMNTQMTRLALSGVNSEAQADIEKKAFEISKVVGRPVSDVVNDFRHMRAAMGDEVVGDPYAKIKGILDKVESTAVLLSAATGESSDMAMGRLIKAVELRGDLTNPITHEIDPERFMRGLEAARKLLTAANGMAGTPDLLAMMKQAGPALRMIDDPMDALASVLAPMIDVGGARTGTGLTAGMRQMIGGSMIEKYAAEMQALGIIKPGDQWTYTTPFRGGNSPITLKNGAISEDTLNKIQKEGFFAWSQDILKQRLEANGITSASDISAESYRLFSTETFRRIMTLYTTQAAQVVRDAAILKGIPDLDKGMDILRQQSFDYNAGAAGSSIQNWLATATKPAIQPLISVFHGVKSIFDASTDRARGEGIWSKDQVFDPFRPPAAFLWDWWRPRDNPTAPPPDTRPIMMKGDVVLDGKKVGEFTANKIGEQAARPSNGPTGTDIRISIPQPGFGGGP